MAFIKKKLAVYPWPIEVSKPSESKPGEFESTTFTIKFIRLKTSELVKFDVESEEIEAVEMLKKIVAGWIDYTDEDGKDIPFSDKELAEIAEDADMVQAISSGYTAFYANAQAKN
tara:strand:- start:411 stop:755 length:345 start_codon:yes stop_codon:yes gene_type:complete